MSKKVFNPYRDMLDIPSLTDENPTDYQLLGIDDFESDSGKIAAAHEKRMQRIAELYQTITKMSQQIDDARDRISDPQKKQEYDLYLRKMGIAGLPSLGRLGFFSVLFSFVLSIAIVIVALFYIYPMVVPIQAENIGDSVTTLPEYNEDQNQKDKDVLKELQGDVSTMDANLNLPIDVDASTSEVDFVDVPLTESPAEETAVDELPDVDSPVTTQEPAAPEVPAAEQPAAPEVPAAEQPSAPEVPAAEEPAAPEVPAAEQPAAPEVPAAEEPAAPEVPAAEEPAAPEVPAAEEPAAPEVPAAEQPAAPEVPAAEQPAAPEVPAAEEPAAPEVPAAEEPAAPEVPAAEEPAAEKSDVTVESPASQSLAKSGFFFDSNTPSVPKVSDSDNAGIPELPPLEEVTASEPPAAPEPPVIPELSAVSEATRGAGITRHQTTLDNADNVRSPETLPAENNLHNDFSRTMSAPQNDILERFVQLGSQARTSEDFTQLLFSARQAEEELMKEKMFQKAQRIADVVYESCSRCPDKTYRAEAYRHKELVAKRSAWWNAVQSAQEKMDSDGTLSSKDASVIAQWTIEIENDWDVGLKYLAMSENEQVRNAARNEILANHSDVRSVLSIANSWWNLAQDPVSMQRQFRAHACMWYAKALPSIADKQIRTLVEKRISMAEQTVGSRQ